MTDKVYMERVRLNRGGYDSFGSYWGVGGPLWRIDDPQAENGARHLRARDREHAKAVYREQWRKDAVFYR